MPFTPLSQASLWDRMARFYAERGPAVWAEGLVPTQITTNAWIASAYARFLVDWAEAAVVDRGQPVYVLELGAGTGALTARLARAIAAERLPDSPRVVVVTTDLSEVGVEAARQHPVLAPLIEAGQVDVAVLDLDDPGSVHLRASGEVLSADRPGNPVGIIANYVLDSVRQDLWHVADGHLSAVRVEQRARGRKKGVSLAMQRVPADDPPTGDPLLDGLLEVYRTGLSDGWVLVPVRALHGLRHLLALGGDRGVILVGDKARPTLADWDDPEPPYLAVHDEAISTHANTHAVGWLVEQLGGFALHADSAGTHFTVSALVAGLPEPHRPALRRAWRRHVASPHPGELQALWEDVRDHAEDLDVEALIAMVRLLRADPAVIRGLADALLGAVDDADDEARQDVLALLDDAAEAAFPIGDDEDVHFELGRLAWRLDAPERAGALYAASLEHHGPHPATFTNLGLVAEARGDLDGALAWAEQALELDPDRKKARKLKKRVVRALRDG